MAYVILKHLNVYPIGEQAPGTVLNRDEFAPGTDFAKLIANGMIRGDEDEPTEMPESDGAGWKERAQKLQKQLDENPDASALAEHEGLVKEYERLSKAHEKLRGEHEDLKAKVVALTNENVALKNRCRDLGGGKTDTPATDKSKRSLDRSAAKAEAEGKSEPAEGEDGE